MSKWKSNVTNYKLVTKEKMDHVFELVKQCLSNTLENRKILEQKALAIVGILVTISTAILGFIVTHLDIQKAFQKQDWAIILPVGLLLLLFYLAMRSVIRSLYPVKYFPPGNEPKMTLTQEHLDQPLRYMIYAEIHNMQERIETNDGLNEEKAKAIQNALFLAAAAPIAAITLFCLIKITPPVFNMLALWIRGIV
ncbi:MAG TPA: hypothetical protein V6C99_09155 [Oculatellaceae cyanobacterium]